MNVIIIIIIITENSIHQGIHACYLLNNYDLVLISTNFGTTYSVNI